MATYGTNNPSYKHGLTDTKEHKIWIDMRQRCGNPNRTNYKFYGGRGIFVCARWLSFENFLMDMGKRPSARHSIERIDNDGPYSPENCKWATPEEQRHNYSRNHWIEVRGIRKTIGDWARELNGDERVIRGRIKRYGWSEERAVTTPILRDGRGGKPRYSSYAL